MILVGAVVTRTVYDHRIGGFGLGQGRAQGRNSQSSSPVDESQLRAALDASLWRALLAGAGAALVVAVIVWASRAADAEGVFLVFSPMVPTGLVAILSSPYFSTAVGDDAAIEPVTT